ncbi:Uncharacterised protein [uncultured archaeon]|nr:Uncharacterised protein [uncultured archaeon]
MDLKGNTLYPLLVLFFVIGLAVGYVIHQPGTEVRYITNTVEVPKIVEKIVEITPAPTVTATEPATTPIATAVPDFDVKIYDPAKDIPTKEIQIVNWGAKPNQMSIHPGQTVLIKVVDYPGGLGTPEFIMGSYDNPKLGTAGQIVIKFNKTGTYDFKVVIPQGEGITPTLYASGTIVVY